MAIGKYSLNLFGCAFEQRNFATSISQLLSNVVHKVSDGGQILLMDSTCIVYNLEIVHALVGRSP